jgi:hypothetical protein
MNLHYFRVIFGCGPSVEVGAFCEAEATILAQAIRIKRAQSYRDIVQVIQIH